MNASDISSEIKTALAENKAVIGANSVKKMLRAGRLKVVVLASNCPENIKDDIMHYSKLAAAKVENFESTGKELGIICGKPFSIAVLGIRQS